MARISFSTTGNTPFEQLLGHRPEILKQWSELENVFLKVSRLSSELKEEVRRTLAYSNGCHYCMAKGQPAITHTDAQILAATTFAQKVAHNHREITDKEIAILLTEFGQEEISELCAFICFITACQMFGAILNLQPTCSLSSNQHR
jgi:Uncharacterized conserved protein